MRIVLIEDQNLLSSMLVEALAQQPDLEVVGQSDKAGANLLVWKNVSLSELVDFIRHAQKAYRIFPSVHADSPTPVRFTEVERRILQLLVQGMSTREIAAALFLGYGTVRLYISRMYTATCFSTT